MQLALRSTSCPASFCLVAADHRAPSRSFAFSNGDDLGFSDESCKSIDDLAAALQHPACVRGSNSRALLRGSSSSSQQQHGVQPQQRFPLPPDHALMAAVATAAGLDGGATVGPFPGQGAPRVVVASPVHNDPSCLL